MSDQPIKVLVVDDHELVRTGLRSVLDGDTAIHVVAEASDGVQALAAIAMHRPDLVVMDLQMPGMGGIEATRRIRANPSTGAVPIIALTAHALPSERARALEAGCDDYDTKPVELERLLGKITALLAKE